MRHPCVHFSAIRLALLRLSVLFCLLFAVPGTGALAAGAPDPAQGATAFVGSLGNRATAIIEATEDSSAARRAALSDLFDAAVDTAPMARAAVSRSWDRMDEAQQQAYEALFRAYFLGNVVRLLDEYEPGGFAFVRAEATEDGQVAVTMQATRFGLALAQIGWIVEPRGNGFVVSDIVMNRISTVDRYRAEFAAVIMNRGVAGLMTALRRQVSS